MSQRSRSRRILMKMIHPFRYDMENDHLHRYYMVGKRLFPDEILPLGVTLFEECGCGKTRTYYVRFSDLDRPPEFP